MFQDKTLVVPATKTISDGVYPLWNAVEALIEGFLSTASKISRRLWARCVRAYALKR